MTETFATPDDLGEGLASDLHTSLAERLAAQGGEAFMGGIRMVNRLRAYGEAEGGQESLESQIARVQAGEDPGQVLAAPRPPADVPIEDAKARVKQEGLEGRFKLTDQASIRAPVLDLMIEAAHERQQYDAAVARGPQGFWPGALGWLTEIGAGIIDPVNAAAFSIPVVGEARMGMILARAGESLAARAGVKAAVGAAQGAVGTTLLEPADWWLHTRDGLDYTMADALRSVLMGAGMGAVAHAGLGGYADVRARVAGAPLKGSIPDLQARAIAGDVDAAELLERMGRGGVRQLAPGEAPAAGEAPGAPPSEEVPGIAAPAPENAPPSGAPEIPGPTGGEAEGASASLPEALPADEERRHREARDAVQADVADRLVAAGMDPERAHTSAAVVAGRYNSLARALGTDALTLYRAEATRVRSGEAASEEEPGLQLFQFGGERAATADLGALARAKELDVRGTKPEDIWRETGWYKRADGWRFEIDDSKVDFKADALEQRTTQDERKVYRFYGRLGDLIDAPQLFAAYPELADLPTRVGPLLTAGSINPETRALAVMEGSDRSAILSSLLHEIQHAIQLTEGFDPGGNVGMLLARTQTALYEITQQIAGLRPGSNVRGELEKMRRELRTQAERMSGGLDTMFVTPRQRDAYMRLLGEVEARNTQARQFLPAEARRFIHPAETEDVPAAEQYRGAGLATLDERHGPLIDRLVREGLDLGDAARTRDGETDQVAIDTIRGERGNVDEALQFAPESVADKIRLYGARALRDVLEPKRDMAREAAERQRSAAPGSGTMENFRSMHSFADELDRRALALEKIIGLLDDMIRRHPEVAERPGYVVRPADPHGLIEAYAGPARSKRELDELNDRIMAAIKDPHRNGGLDSDDAESMAYNFRWNGVGRNWLSADRQHPEGFARLRDKNKSLFDEYDKVAANLDYQRDKARAELRSNPSLSMSWNVLRQPGREGGEPRGRITLGAGGQAVVDLFARADASTFMHEMAHKWLDELVRYASRQDAPAALKDDLATVQRWLGVDRAQDITADHHEQWAGAFERYLAEGRAPSRELAGAFERFKQWLMEIYHSLTRISAPISDEVRGVFDRMLATDEERAAMRRHPAEVLADLPPGVREDVARATIADMTAGNAVRAGELLNEAAKESPRVAESLAPPGAQPAGIRRPLLADTPALVTGRPQVDAVLADPAVAAAIAHPRIDRSHDVPYEAGASQGSNPTTHLDSRLPHVAELPSGASFDPAIPANIHEQVEKHVMEKRIAQFRAAHGREPGEAEMNRIYEIAHHEYAEPAEDAWYRAQGIDVGEANAWWAAQDKVTEHEHPANPPPNLYRKPYPHNRVEGVRHEETGVAAEWPTSTAAEAGAPEQANNVVAGPGARADWQALADARRPPDEDLAEASREAEHTPAPESVAPPAKAVTAAEHAAAQAEQLLKDLLPQLSEEERATFEDALDRIDVDKAAREQMVIDGTACLLEALG